MNKKMISWIPLVNIIVTLFSLQTTCIKKPVKISLYFLMVFKFFVLTLLFTGIWAITVLTIHSEVASTIIRIIAVSAFMFAISRLAIHEEVIIKKQGEKIEEKKRDDSAS